MSKWINRIRKKPVFLNQLMKTLHPDTVFNQFSKIRNKIFSLTFLLLFIFGVLGLLVFQVLSTRYEEKVYEEAAQNLNLSSHVLDGELKRIEDLAFQVSTDSFTQRRMEFLRDDNYSFEAYQMQADLIEMMTVLVNQEPYFTSIMMIEPSGRPIEVRSSTRVPENLQDRLELVDEASGDNVWLTSEDREVLYAARKINQSQNLSLDHLGYLIIGIEVENFVNNALDFSTNNNFVIANNSEVIFKDEFETNEVENLLQENIGAGYTITEVGSEDYFVTSQLSEFSDMTYYNMRPFENIANTKKVVTRLTVVFLVLILLFTVFLSRKSAYAISRPIEQLTAKMKQVQNGNFTPINKKEEPYLHDEIGDLQHNFRIMLDKINELIKENYTKQLLIKETEYKALQSQINPHFLYNTLDSINWMAKMEKQNKISSMAEALGNMMRNIISKKSDTITIKEELEIVSNYIIIQKYRYAERLQFHLDCNAELEKARIPKLTIQPLVENAIQHGLEEMTSECHISVRIFFERNVLNITIEDNGPGMSQEKIDKIYQGKIKPKGSGIGLYNIMERINIMFGGISSIIIESEEGKGTKVQISLPFMEDEA